jgi:hypothetical protein
MAIATGVAFSIESGNLDRYSDGIKGSFIINLNSENREKVTAYLNRYKIEWREINNHGR